MTGLLSQKAVALLAYLAVGAPHDYTGDELAGLLWGEADEQHARYYLRRTLWLLRKTINPPGAPSDMYVRYEDRSYKFDRQSDYCLDVSEFECAVGACTSAAALHRQCLAQDWSDSAPSLPDLSVALRLYRGAFLAGCRLPDCPNFADWLQFQRDRLEKKYTQALRAQVTFALSQGSYQAAVAYGRRILEIDNLDEGVMSDLMLAYYRLGARDTALDVYHSFRHMLLQRLELEPLAETRNLYLQIRNGTLAEARTYSLASAQTA